MKFIKSISFFLLIFVVTFNQFSAQISKSKKQELIRYAREMSSKQIKYGETWKPNDRELNYVMDCSNTLLYSYDRIFDVRLPRTSLDQFNYVKKNGKFHASENLINGSGEIDIDKIRKSLQIGDILFWENTYNVSHNPPVSHVMIYLGKNKDGRMKMFGAGSYGSGEQTTNGGIDVYVFDPNRFMGCVKSSTGKCKINGRFIGYGRIL
ncbi:NlpC/P60 family protein [Leptospira sp. GIMC2001]|uniref:NlpC/P60 family protein n=1 Tax=Leptospira sp. GIMC2001 TaxID=1513297 RepID=UPI002348FFCF|nr:NlpC/P60 family protein [Leptospira sp. GIMC2001]WCL47608.1 NlpC/P60 family protein [Leptospira sp. GIMC2001]